MSSNIVNDAHRAIAIIDSSTTPRPLRTDPLFSKNLQNMGFPRPCATATYLSWSNGAAPEGEQGYFAPAASTVVFWKQKFSSQVIFLCSQQISLSTFAPIAKLMRVEMSLKQAREIYHQAVEAKKSAYGNLIPLWVQAWQEKAAECDDEDMETTLDMSYVARLIVELSLRPMREGFQQLIAQHNKFAEQRRKRTPDQEASFELAKIAAHMFAIVVQRLTEEFNTLDNKIATLGISDKLVPLGEEYLRLLRYHTEQVYSALWCLCKASTRVAAHFKAGELGPDVLKNELGFAPSPLNVQAHFGSDDNYQLYGIGDNPPQIANFEVLGKTLQQYTGLSKEAREAPIPSATW